MKKLAINKKIVTPIVTIFLLVAVIAGWQYYVHKKHQSYLEGKAEEIRKVNPELYNSIITSRDESKAAVQKDPKDYKAWVSLGVADNFLGDQTGAVEAYKKAVAIQPVSSVPWNNLTDIYQQQQKYADAENAYKQWIQNIPGDTDAYLGLARLYASGKIGNSDEAIKVLENGAKVVADPKGLQQAIEIIKKGEVP